MKITIIKFFLPIVLSTAVAACGSSPEAEADPDEVHEAVNQAKEKGESARNAAETSKQAQ